MFGIPLSGVLGGPLSGWIISSLHAYGLCGWQWMLLLEALPAIAGGILVFAFLGDTPMKAAWLDASAKAIVERDLAGESEAKTLHSVRDGLANGRIWSLSALYMAFTPRRRLLLSLGLSV